MSVVPINILLQMFTENTSYFCRNERFSSSCKNEMFHESYRHIAVPAYRNNTSEGNSFLFGWCSFVFSIQRVSECSTTLFYNIQSNHLLPMINNIYIYMLPCRHISNKICINVAVQAYWKYSYQ